MKTLFSSLQGKALYAQAITAYSQGKTQDTINLLMQYLDKFSDHVDSLKILGICHFDQGGYRQAIKIFSEVTNKQPYDIEAFLTWLRVIPKPMTCKKLLFVILNA